MANRLFASAFTRLAASRENVFSNDSRIWKSNELQALENPDMDVVPVLSGHRLFAGQAEVSQRYWRFVVLP